MWWKAWYELEPRGEERGDWHAAMMTMPYAKQGSSLLDLKRILQDLWHPVTKDEKRKRKEEKKRAARKKMNDYSRSCAKALQGKKDGPKRRQVVDPNGG